MVDQSNLISIIVPVYKVEKYIGRCIESLCAQTYRHLEIVLVDDGSPDSSGAICDAYAQKDSRIVVIHKKNGGVSSARNAGLDVARGDYIGFVDGDDYVSTTMYERLIGLFTKYDIDISVVGFANEKENGVFQPYCTEEGERLISGEEQLVYLLRNKLYSCSCCDKLFKRDVIGDIRLDEKITNYEDLLFLYEVMKRSRAASFDPEVGYYYCSNAGSATTSRFSKKKMTMLDVCEYIYRDAREHVPSIVPVARTELVRNTLMCADLAAQDGYADQADIKRMQAIVRRNFWFFMRSYQALGYKVRAAVFAVSFSLFQKQVRKSV